LERCGSDVEHHDLATPQSGSELVAVEKLDALTLAGVGGSKPVETNDSLPGDSPLAAHSSAASTD
jgi:hypothetical protein